MLFTRESVFMFEVVFEEIAWGEMLVKGSKVLSASSQPQTTLTPILEPPSCLQSSWGSWKSSGTVTLLKPLLSMSPLRVFCFNGVLWRTIALLAWQPFVWSEREVCTPVVMMVVPCSVCQPDGIQSYLGDEHLGMHLESIWIMLINVGRPIFIVSKAGWNWDCNGERDWIVICVYLSLCLHCGFSVTSSSDQAPAALMSLP